MIRRARRRQRRRALPALPAQPQEEPGAARIGSGGVLVRLWRRFTLWPTEWTGQPVASGGYLDGPEGFTAVKEWKASKGPPRLRA